MEFFIIIICVVAVVAISAFVVLKIKNLRDNASNSSESAQLSINKKSIISERDSREMVVAFDSIPTLTESEERCLIEVKDEKLLARIDSAIPGTLQAIANTRALKEYSEAAKAAGQLYQAILPKGAILDKSRALEGAVRGSYREKANSIKGQANWIPVDNGAANKLAVMNGVNAVMGVSAMIVGQYYMTQINDQLEGISSNIEKIVDFQQNEFKSQVYALVAEIQKSSIFQVETVENNELKNRELQHLKMLEHECAQLLGQTNLSLQDIIGNDSVDYNKYEKLTGEAEFWFQYQQILLEVMYKISDLTYALNLGAISRENSYALYLPYAKQSEGVLLKLRDWHKENVEKHQISLDNSRRKRQGAGGFIMGVLGSFNDDLNYKKMSDRTVSLITHQGEGKVIKVFAQDDLFQNDVRLVAKDGKLYYLPSEQIN